MCVTERIIDYRSEHIGTRTWKGLFIRAHGGKHDLFPRRNYWTTSARNLFRAHPRVDHSFSSFFFIPIGHSSRKFRFKAVWMKARRNLAMISYIKRNSETVSCTMYLLSREPRTFTETSLTRWNATSKHIFLSLYTHGFIQIYTNSVSPVWLRNVAPRCKLTQLTLLKLWYFNPTFS